jgi:hypothetical protein
MMMADFDNLDDGRYVGRSVLTRKGKREAVVLNQTRARGKR